MKAKTVSIIGAGFSGLSAASFMAKAGWKVHVFEKHETPGGRARQLKEAGFVFDMGPGWYWMPDVFERYFQQFGKKVSDYYSLQRLDPSYRIYWKDGHNDIPASLDQFKRLLESLENGSAKKLDKFLAEAEYKYKVGIEKLVFKPGRSFNEFIDWDIVRGIFKLQVFSSIEDHIHNYFQDPRIRQLLEFPVLFLGALPASTPALYSLMNYADIIGGTWYPQGGMYSVVNAMYQLATELGVEFHFNETVSAIEFNKNDARKIKTSKGEYSSNAIIASADYHFIETSLLPERARSYSEKYWDSRTMAPSCLMYYVGLNKKIKRATHHMLFFDVSFDRHAKEIYANPAWPQDPLFYVSLASVSDKEAAPQDGEALVFLIPVAAGLNGDNEELRNQYFEKIIARFETRVGEEIRNNIVYKKSFSVSDFVDQYNAFKGNAYGLANTLWQTALFRPACRSKKIKNLFYTGQLTVPGPGVPPSLISGEVVARQVLKFFG